MVPQTSGSFDHGTKMDLKILLDNTAADVPTWLEETHALMANKGVLHYAEGAVPDLKYEDTTANPNVRTPFHENNFKDKTRIKNNERAIAISIVRMKCLTGEKAV